MKIAEFLRLYPLRAPNLMWFLGAGASASAGVPTASHMIWDFKRSIYCSAQHVSIQACADLGSSVVRSRLQRYFDAQGGACPALDSEEEYPFFFEAAYPDERDRRKYIDRHTSAATPSYGHLAMAVLMKLGLVRIVWTTNFDRVIEDAAIQLLGGSGRLTVASLDASGLARQAMDEERWPLVGKLHGDFLSRRLKNTSDELRSQDATLRDCLVETCRRYGLAVIGYSGRDRSVMEALEAALADGQGYPSGLFWFHHGDGPASLRVSSLIEKARGSGIDAHVVDGQTFDETLSDTLLLIPDVPDEVRKLVDRHAKRVSDAPIPESRGTWPVIRLNALPLTAWPATCRRVVCEIGGIREVREAIEAAGADVIATRRRVGVLAFGPDAEVRKAFGQFGITEFDVQQIEAKRLRYESMELGLLYDALGRALARDRPLGVARRRGGRPIAVVAPGREGDEHFRLLSEATTSIRGTVPGTQLAWAEAIDIRLEYRLNRLFLLFEPTVWAEHTMDPTVAGRRKEFIRERLARRYNRDWNGLLEAWVYALVGEGGEAELRAFGVDEGVDATFRVAATTAFSWRGMTG